MPMAFVMTPTTARTRWPATTTMRATPPANTPTSAVSAAEAALLLEHAIALATWRTPSACVAVPVRPTRMPMAFAMTPTTARTRWPATTTMRAIPPVNTLTHLACAVVLAQPTSTATDSATTPTIVPTTSPVTMTTLPMTRVQPSMNAVSAAEAASRLANVIATATSTMPSACVVDPAQRMPTWTACATTSTRA